MGTNSSKPAPPLSEKQSLALRQIQEDNDYVQIENEKGITIHEEFRTPWKSLSTHTLAHWGKEVLRDSKNRLALSALTQSSPSSVLTSQATLITDSQVFSNIIPIEGYPITYQRSSGRCWIFASTNIFRIALMKRHNLSSFELSQSYLFFYDKLEKANWFLEQILDTVDEALEGQLLQSLLSSPVQDGGQWDMVANLVTKYGLVPQVLYPDAWSAMNSAELDRLMTTKLRQDALVLRDMVGKKSTDDILTVKAKMLKQIHTILVLTLGSPPSPHEPFTWTYLDAASKPQTLTTTPLAFYHELTTPKSTTVTLPSPRPHTLFSLLNDPRHAPNTLLSVSRLGNVVGGSDVTYVNVTMPTLKAACIRMLKAGHPIFFGSDVGKYCDRNKGVMDLDIIDYELGFNIKLGMSKEERILTGESMMTHAMVLTGVHLEKDDDGKEKSVRWRVQNSWGTSVGDHGWFVMSDAWMDQFVYQAVVEGRYVEKEVRDVLEKGEKVWLDLWDPMGALA